MIFRSTCSLPLIVSFIPPTHELLLCGLLLLRDALECGRRENVGLIAIVSIGLKKGGVGMERGG